MTQMDDELMTLFHDEVVEALELLAQILERLATEVGSAAMDDVNAAFRIMHNVKGAARMAGAGAIERAAHAMEDELSRCRDRKVGPSPEGVRQLQHQMSAIYALLEGGLTPEPDRATQDRDSSASVRLEAARLDRLMSFAGEFMAAQTRFMAQHERIEESLHSLEDLDARVDGTVGSAVRKVTRELGSLAQANRRELQRFGYLVSDWATAIQRARMLPVRSIVPQWRRTTMEAAHELGREVRLEIDVGDLEIDRQVLDGLRDPMMHLLRNAIDHGIEDPAERSSAGKPRFGTVAITARARGAMIELEVRDDGRGIDVRRLVERAAAAGVVDEERIARMTEPELRDLVFSAGVSTAKTVSALSGRGVGLDVVRRRVAAIGGRATLGDPGASGTRFVLDVPSSVILTRGLLLRARHAAYVVPTAYVERTLRVAARSVQVVDGASVLPMEGGEPVRLRWLTSLMDEPRDLDGETLIVVVLADGDQRLGVVVTAVEREVELVTKPLPQAVADVEGLVGAMILGDGSVALVIDAPHAVGTGAADEKVHHAPTMQKRRILVVDDSVTSRTLERNILVAAGYDVELAVDGEAAWQALHGSEFSLVVSDVQMPRLDGIELTRRIRGHQRFKKLPVVLVTSLNSPDHVARGGAAGANEYIVKGTFDQRQLLDVVARLV